MERGEAHKIHRGVQNVKEGFRTCIEGFKSIKKVLRTYIGGFITYMEGFRAYVEDFIDDEGMWMETNFVKKKKKTKEKQTFRCGSKEYFQL